MPEFYEYPNRIFPRDWTLNDVDKEYESYRVPSVFYPYKDLRYQTEYFPVGTYFHFRSGQILKRVNSSRWNYPSFVQIFANEEDRKLWYDRDNVPWGERWAFDFPAKDLEKIVFPDGRTIEVTDA